MPNSGWLKFGTSLFSLRSRNTRIFSLRRPRSAVMNGVKRSEMRARPQRACHLPPLEMRYKSPPRRNKFMNTLLAFRARRVILLPRSFSPTCSSCPYPIYPILLGTFGKFLNRPNHGVQRPMGRRSGRTIGSTSYLRSIASPAAVRPSPSIITC